MTDKQKLAGSQIAGDSGHKRAWELGEKKEGDEEILFYLLFASRTHSDDVMAGLRPVRRDGGSDLMRSTVVAVRSFLVLLAAMFVVVGTCAKTSRGRSDTAPGCWRCCAKLPTRGSRRTEQGSCGRDAG